MTELIPKNSRKEYFCTNCNAVLNEQEGFSPQNEIWTCNKCGQFLYGDIYDGEKYKNYMWYCDKCGALLNKQIGFRDCFDKWICTECGTVENFTVTINPNEKAQLNVESNKSFKPIVKKAVKWIIGVGSVIAASAIAIKKAQNHSNNYESYDFKDNDMQSDDIEYSTYEEYLSGCDPQQHDLYMDLITNWETMDSDEWENKYNSLDDLTKNLVDEEIENQTDIW